MPFIPYLPDTLLSDSARASAAKYAWLKQNLVKKIQITGQRNIGVHFQDVQGDGDAFNSLNYNGQGANKVTDTGQANVTGRNVLGVLNFDFKFSANRFGDPQAQHTSLNYAKGPWGVDLGDIQGTLLNTNQFASFNKTLKGVMAGYANSRFQFRALRSSVKGSAKTVSIQGNGGLGPYYLNTSQLIADSEQVRVDGEPLKIGTDYTIDYQLGSITFTTKPVAQTSTITVTFEALGVNGSSGMVQGAGAQYSFGKLGKLGFTRVEQLRGGSVGLGNKTDLFQGYGSPDTPYTLSYQPQPGSALLVKVDGRLQTEGIDYRRDAGNDSLFYFLRFISTSSTVEATYTPKPTQTVDGDRRVYGWDYQLPFKSGTFSYSQAKGSLFNTPTPSSATARGAALTYLASGFSFSVNAKDVPPGYVGIETRGFQRNERAFGWALSKKVQNFKYGLESNNSSASSVNDFTTSQVTSGRTTLSRAFAEYRNGPTNWSLTQAHTTSSAAAGDSKLDTTTLATTRRFGKLATSWNFQRLSGFGNAITDGKSTRTAVASDSMGLTAGYDLGRSWSASSKYSVSNTRGGGVTGRGVDMSYTLGFNPSHGNFSSNLSYVQSRSGTVSVLSQFNNGTGFGYDSASFGSGVADTAGANASTDVKALSLVNAFRLGPRLRFDTHVNSIERQGSVSSNTRSVSFGTGMQLDLKGSSALNMSLDRSLIRYLGSETRSGSTTLDTTLTGAFKRKWLYRLGVNSLLSSGGTYSQNRFNYDASLSRFLSKSETLSVSFQTGRSLGYQPQEDGYFGVSYAKSLVRGVALVTSYKWRKLLYLDGNTSTGGYRSRGLDMELALDFGR